MGIYIKKTYTYISNKLIKKIKLYKNRTNKRLVIKDIIYYANVELSDYFMRFSIL